MFGFVSRKMSRDKFNRMNKALVRWDEMTGEIERLTQEYDEEGWETLVLHPGDVVPQPAENDSNPAFRLTVPDSELDALSEFVGEDNSEFDEYETHRAATNEVKLYLIILKSTTFERAVFYPVYYDPSVDMKFVDDVRDSDVMYTTVTNLNKSQELMFFHDNPGLFLQ